MKKERILFAMCAVAALTACTDNELTSISEGSKSGNSAIELTIAQDAETRGVWMGDDQAKFNWQLNDKIGLSMVSREQDPASITADDYTLTNYEFTAKAGGSVIGYPSTTGYFETENATVFDGTYVAYYPYNKQYSKPSKTIPVSSPYIQYTDVTNSDKRGQFSGDNSFTYSKPFAMNGGREAKQEIVLQNLSGTFKLNLKYDDLNTIFGSTGISYIIATTGDFNLGEKKENAGEFPVKGDLKSVIVTPADDAAEYTEYQEALVMHMSSQNKATGYNTDGALTINQDEAVYMVTLPRPNFFSEGYKFYLVDANHKAYEIEKTAAVFAANNITTIKGTFQPIGINAVAETKVNNTPVYVAADGASLVSLSNVAPGSQIYIFNNIELESDLTFANSVELIAAKNQGKITVPAGKKLTFNTNSTINTEVEVLGSTDAGLVANDGLTIGSKGKVTNNTPFTVAAEKQVVVAGEYTNNATFTVAAPAATTSQANRGLKVTGTFNNNGTVDNYGTVANTNVFNNNSNAYFLDQIGSKLSGKSMTMDETAEYICIVDRQERLLEAVSQRPSTTIRLKNCEEGVQGYNRTAYDFQSYDWSKYKFEIIDSNVAIQNSDPATYEKAAKIKSLTVVNGMFVQEDNAQLEIVEDLTNNGTATFKNKCNVGGNVYTNGRFTMSGASSNLTDRMLVKGDFTIGIDGSATFENNIIVRIIGSNGVINNGNFVITDATVAGKVPAIVYAKAFSGNGTWANYPTVVNDPENPYNN